MKNRQGVWVIVFFVMSLLQIQCTFGRGLSTSEEREKAIRIARTLEQDPLAADAPANRQWLLSWIIEVPDIRFNACDELLSPGVGSDYPYATLVNEQIIFSAAAFKLEHANHLRDDTGAYIAGVEGALRVYDALVASAPDARLPFLDDLVAKRDRGDLVDHVADLAKNQCKKAKTGVILNLAGAGVGLLLALLIARVGRFGIEMVRLATIRRLVFLSAAYYAGALILLHILEPDFDPRFRFMSEYALGHYGWLMTTTFFVLGLAVFCLAVAVRRVYPSLGSARLGFGLLTVAGLFVCLAGVFKDSLPHLLASLVVFPSMVMAVLLLSWSFRRVAGWQPIDRVLLLIALGMLVLFVLMVADVGTPGLYQRAFISLLLVWLMMVAARLVRRAAAS